jgi:hypothetical protein
MGPITFVPLRKETLLADSLSNVQERSMTLSKISLAALAATFIAASAASAHAESNVSGLDGGITSESTLSRESHRYASSYGYAPYFTVPATRAYGYAPRVRSTRHTVTKPHHN